LQLASRNNGLHNVTDIVQGSLVCNDYKQMEIILKRLTKSTAVSVHHICNGFEDPDFIHYRSLIIAMSINISSEGGTGGLAHCVQLQLHLRPMYELLSSCETPRDFFLGQGGLCGNEKHRASDLKKRMDVVHVIGRTPVLLSVFLMFIKASTSRLLEEERDETADAQTCPPMPTSLHYLYQEALWEALVSRTNYPAVLLDILQRIAFENMKLGNNREFTIRDVEKCDLLSKWPKSDHIPLIKILDNTVVSSKSSGAHQGLYQFSHLSFQEYLATAYLKGVCLKHDAAQELLSEEEIDNFLKGPNVINFVVSTSTHLLFSNELLIC